MGRWKLAFGYLLFGAMAALVVWSNLGPDTTESHTPDPDAVKITDERALDPVCNMDVNPNWGLSFVHEGKTFHFCNKRCKERFAADPHAFVGERCPVCNVHVGAKAFTATYMDKTYRLCSEDHRKQFKEEPAAYFMHTMWGIPDWLYYVSIGLVLLISFLMFEGAAAFKRIVGKSPHTTGDNASGGGGARGLANMFAFLRAGLHPQSNTGGAAGAAAISLPVLQEESVQPTRNDRIDLMKFGFIRTMFRSRVLRFAFQFFMAAAFIMVVAAGLFGNQNPSLNIAPLLTWTIWWCGLVVLIMFAGKAWCYMCPWDAIARWMEKLRFWKKTDDGLGLNMKWPRRLRNVWLATFLFIGLTWVELGFGITMSPAATAYIALAMLVLTIVCVFLFDRQSFCRYGCLVGRVSGLYAMFSGVEVRARDTDICKDCKTKECIKGSETAYGCPTFQNPSKMNVNTYCIQCGECLQSCPHENMTVNLRPWGDDLAAEGKPRSDEAYLALLMLAISGFHGLTMTPVWGQLTGGIESAMPIGRIAAFSLGMTLLMVAPILVFAALVWLSHRIAVSADPIAAEQNTFRDYFIRYAYCVLPIALFYHLAHNLEHLLMEGPKVVALASDPFGWQWDLLGTASWHVPPMVSLETLWILQIILVAVGHVYSLWAARLISRRIFTNPIAAARGQWPMLLGMIAFSVFSLWLLKQPMEMRTSAM